MEANVKLRDTMKRDASEFKDRDINISYCSFPVSFRIAVMHASRGYLASLWLSLIEANELKRLLEIKFVGQTQGIVVEKALYAGAF